MRSLDPCEVLKNEFQFLKEKFTFDLVEYGKENWGCKLLFLNKTTAVKLVYEVREAFLFVTLYRLEKGEFKENPNIINLNTKLNGFGLNDIVALKKPEDYIYPAYHYGQDSVFFDEEEGFSRYFSLFAKNVREHAKEILLGNFSLFPALDRIVKQRIQDFS